MSDPDSTDSESDQLDSEDTLLDDRFADVLDEGYSPPEREWAADEDADLDSRLAREIPDETVDDQDADWESDSDDTDGELLDDQVGDRRAGRLVDASQGGVSDTDSDAWARDVGIDGAGASAEEAAVHVVDDEE
ncbi:DUF5709 domain-containing protein [Pseudonocardia xishanensis]|uniref:DUF5709 domain-containing protein n=1 Tax=Pseudonocardia xishanensis TaxID=630995 RepID=A0ABP8RY43_9PSEU